MKYLTDRQEIAQAMNFGKYPVIRIDVETPVRDGVLQGDAVKVAAPNDRYPDNYICGHVMKFDDDDRYVIMPENVCLKAYFGYSDVVRMLGYAKAPMLHAGEVVVLIEDAPKLKTARVRMMRVSDSVRDFAFPTCYLEDLEG